MSIVGETHIPPAQPHTTRVVRVVCGTRLAVPTARTTTHTWWGRPTRWKKSGVLSGGTRAKAAGCATLRDGPQKHQSLAMHNITQTTEHTPPGRHRVEEVGGLVGQHEREGRWWRGIRESRQIYHSNNTQLGGRGGEPDGRSWGSCRVARARRQLVAWRCGVVCDLGRASVEVLSLRVCRLVGRFGVG